ncbi:DNase I-like protein [Neolentinus lepideus HHB14362 ss-1]|uniref:DNase I-like protein n=1 Tax=Neolentinus lepideus HHB14362 ss-1 TaxID=1314782 RepID=A0A165T4P6_9AGAM|nr:DNase I-like protein [Neolentinus lepideus HHB14362 ss-1]
MAQTRHNTIDLRPSDSHSVSNQSRTDDANSPISLLTHDVQGLRSVLAECKRLKTQAEEREQLDSPGDYSWMQYYTTKHTPISLLSKIPLDLRTITKPLHTLLSPASAGLPGGDEADLDLIREEWVRSKAEGLAARKQCNLRIRVGTFNVNGKMPSQDLSPWVRGVETNNGYPTVLPPLNPISPLSMGEMPKKRSDTEYDAKSVGSNTGTTESTTMSTLETISVSSSTLSSDSTIGGVDATGTPLKTDVEDTESDPDLLVFGFQELDLSTEALLYSSKTTREEAWCTAILAGLGEKGVLYEKLASKQLVGMLLMVFVKARLKEHFRDIKVCAVGAGLLGIMGNKGGAAIRLTYVPPTGEEGSVARPIIMTFVNAHLAAFDDMVDRRNADFHDLARRLVFDVTPEPTNATDPSLLTTLPIGIFESDLLFWMVYLNYRIDLSDSDVRTLLNAEPRDRNIQALLEFDQLRRCMRDGKSFQGFTEHHITRLPTYRFSAGLLTDSLGYDMKRKPAWTDRILYIKSPKTAVRQESYAGHPEITFSDHRPISADFQITMPLVDDARFQSVVRTHYHEVVNMEDSEQPPKVKLDSALLEFGHVSYEIKTPKVVVLRNVSQVSCAYRFVPLEANGPIHPLWLEIEPTTGLLLPGETTDIRITVHVTKESASELNLRSRKLDCTLILHTIFGKDHFITVHGEYQPTCFANKLSDLVKLPGPIRELAEPNKLLPEDQAISAPREVMRIINWLMTYAAETHDLFVEPGTPELVASIRESLDTGADFIFKANTDGQYDRQTKTAFGEALLQFLDSLVEPVIPRHLYSRCLQVNDRDEAFEVWISLTAFLHFISQQPGENANDGTPPTSRAELLASVFAPILFRNDPALYPPSSPVGTRRFLLFFIQ